MPESMPDAGFDVPVLIVGGGISGLSAAAFLSYHEVPCLLVERKPGHSEHPRMTDVGPRSMELYRNLGLEGEIRAVDEGTANLIIRVDTLAGTELERHSMGGGPDELAGVTPTEQIWCDQDQLEPIVRRYAESHGAEIRFGWELVDERQTDDHVLATIRELASGQEHTVSASYLLACDGIHSPVRERLGIGRHGPGVFTHQAGILFSADLTEPLRGRKFVLCLVDDLDRETAEPEDGDHLHVLLRRNLGRWTLSVPYHPDRGQRPEDFTDARCLELIRSAVGVPDLGAEILDVDTWPMQALVTDRYQDGRVFLVGDAGHALPPTGGFGGNTCIQDAHNIAWKLAAVLDGSGSDALLDSYDAERRPVADLMMEQSLARAGLFLSGAAAGGSEQPPDQPDKSSVTMGYVYRAGALLPDPSADDATPIEDPHRPTVRAGCRAPHLVVSRGGQELSTLDLFGHGFVLLTGPGGGAWRRAAERSAAELGVRAVAYRIGSSDTSGVELVDVAGRWADSYRLKGDGAVLVRPDGFIGWRCDSAPADPAWVLRDVLAALLGTGARA